MAIMKQSILPAINIYSLKSYVGRHAVKCYNNNTIINLFMMDCKVKSAFRTVTTVFVMIPTMPEYIMLAHCYALQCRRSISLSIKIHSNMIISIEHFGP